MQRRLTTGLMALLAILTLSVATVLPAQAQASIEDAATNVEQTIQTAMKNAGRSGQPTLGQLGGVQGGSTAGDASGGASGSGGSSGGSSSGGGRGGGTEKS